MAKMFARQIFSFKLSHHKILSDCYGRYRNQCAKSFDNFHRSSKREWETIQNCLDLLYKILARFSLICLYCQATLCFKFSHFLSPFFLSNFRNQNWPYVGYMPIWKHGCKSVSCMKELVEMRERIQFLSCITPLDFSIPLWIFSHFVSFKLFINIFIVI